MVFNLRETAAYGKEQVVNEVRWYVMADKHTHLIVFLQG